MTVDRQKRPDNRPIACIYIFEQLVGLYEKDAAPLHKALADIVEVVPSSMSLPGPAVCRIIVSPVAFSSEGFVQCEQAVRSPILFQGAEMGSVEVGYRPDTALPPQWRFTPDEALMVDYLAMRIGNLIELTKIKERLRLESESLRNANIALSEVLRRTQEENKETGRHIQLNIKNVLGPLIANFSLHLPPQQRKFLDLISRTLDEITAPYVPAHSDRFLSLTPQEMAICHMIRNGLSSKEIAGLQKISAATVHTHRENIRRKLKLNNKKINLKSFLIDRVQDASR